MKYLKRNNLTWEDYLIGGIVFTCLAIIGAVAGAVFTAVLNFIG